jgi:L-seryl-tRNA(Ser) seleniumtransferase
MTMGWPCGQPFPIRPAAVLQGTKAAMVKTSQTQSDAQTEYRRLPAVDALLRLPPVTVLAAEYGQAQVTETVRGLLDDARRTIAAGGHAPAAADWPARLAAALEAAQQPSLRPVINATGVIVHTNLGRAPLSAAALAAVQAATRGYSNLEYELAAGSRGSRHDHARRQICALTGAEDALVVNNNAAAVYLVLAALCASREVVISRGQLVEIGGGFRIPDVLRQSGARLVEVGTTNRTHPRDFAAAVTPETAAFMRVHSSNFRQIGFVTEPSLAELAEIAHDPGRDAAPVILIDDLGSGTLLDTRAFGLAPEPRVQESLAAGADLVTFSGDKLLGGPQAGLIVGRGDLVARLRRHPMARALRVDKMTLAALDATLGSYQRGRATTEIPVWQMIAAPLEALTARAGAWAAQMAPALPSAPDDVQIWPGESAVGGGSLPGETLPTALLAIRVAHAEQVSAALRARRLPVVCRVQKDHLVFDPRTVLPDQDADLVEAVRAALMNP